ncbi:CRISPR-associated protein, Cas6 family [Seinonella peptonophila]|uniref:CRISPR-associated endoribonuclease n=1 Tax=Seinonella peptonophila TaxID=112248 RepID=A0A1M4VL85_9BACL|nr:CRISPR-associated endoribonuclease Cas6 [Seinonella peptonophila]SHE69573.1 CRISPR-associated protein, Cas6 family [Seinonella peptonophila]
MRIKVTCFLPKEASLPYSLNYAVSSYLYRCITLVDPKLGTWLHQEGLKYHGRTFKPIVFSRLRFASRRNRTTHMEVQGHVTFQVDSINPQIIRRLMEGMWKLGEFQLLDLHLPLQSIQVMKAITFSEKMRYRSISPIVVPLQIEGKLHFCHPLESDFYDQLRKSVANWYFLKWHERISEDTFIRLRLLDPEKFQLRKAATLLEYKEKKIKGYEIPLYVEAPPRVQQVLYESGAGSLSSQGFGMLEGV